MNLQVSRFQFFSIVLNFIIYSSILMAPGITVINAKQDGWLSMLLALGVGLAANFLYLMLFKKHGYPSLFELMDRSAGKWIGTALNIVIVFYALHLTAMVVRNLSNFMITDVSPYSSPYIYQILILLVVAYTSYHGVKNLFLISELFTPFISLFVIGSLIVIIKHFKIIELKPFFYNPPSAILEGAYSTLGFPFIEIMLAGAFLTYVKRKDKLVSIALSAIAIGGAVLVITVILVIGNDSAYIVARESYPTYSVMRDVSLTTTFKRVEIIIGIAWIIGLFFKISTCFCVAMMGIKHLSKSKTFRGYIVPCAILVWAMSNGLHKTFIDFTNFVSMDWTLYWFTLYSFVIITMLIGLARKRA
ncbi:GerAB/ArcD/ProY family transporter [Pseudalkalibacillus caeni]|nr:endospore germination permease [Pseudalkalibacillus caeni]